MELATLGGGCFWCLEPLFKEMRGVSRVTSGYAGGQSADPTYAQVCAGRTGHAEVVQIEFDPAAVSYADLLTVFFTMHDPTTLNRQGADAGTQYRSIVLTHSDAQRAEAEAAVARASELWERKAVTEVVPFERFFPAEPEHHDYFARNPGAGYCRAVVAPKVVKFRKQFAARLKAA